MSKEKVGLQKIVLDKIKSEGLKTNNYSVLVMDKYSSKILSSFCKTTEIFSEKIALIEDLEKDKRKPFTELDAIYLIKPDPKSVAFIINDFNLNSKVEKFKIEETEKDDKKPSVLDKIICFRKLHEHYTKFVYKDTNKENTDNITKEPEIKTRYKSAHVCFLGQTDSNLERKLRESPASAYIKSIKHIDVNFYPIERQIFTMRMPELSFDFYIETSESRREGLETLADQLVSLCLSLDEYPTIRYRNEHNLRDDFVVLVQKKLDKEKQKNPSLGQSGPEKARSQLLIIDRSFDCISPLLHEFTYQAMTYDLLNVDPTDNKYKYEGDKSCELNENDDVWVDLRHQHIDVIRDLLLKNFEKFRNSHHEVGKSDLTIEDLRLIVKKLPQHQKELISFQTHLSLTSKCFEKLTENRKKMSDYEQSIAMNCGPDGEPVKDSPKDIIDLILSKDFDENDKLRLLMLILLNKNGASESGIDTYMSKLNEEKRRGMNVIEGLRKMGLEIIKEVDKSNKNIDRENKRERVSQYVLSRWTPLVKDLMEDIIENKLNKKKYPYLNDNLANLALNQTGAGGVSARSGAVNRKQEKGPTLIVFIIGGVTYSEMRSAYEVQKDSINKENWQIYMGSNEIIRPIDFMQNLSKIKN